MAVVVPLVAASVLIGVAHSAVTAPAAVTVAVVAAVAVDVDVADKVARS